jgi:two-component system chemotaxis sensor kinase CheA
MVDGISTRILRLDQVINSSSPDSTVPLSQMSLILPKFVPEPVGILVSKIVDTESLSMELQEHPEQDPGILGSAFVRGRLTLFLDMHRMAEKLFGKIASRPAFAVDSTSRAKRLLLVDDTAFFREVVKRYFVAEGLEVETAVNGEAGLAQLAARPEFDLIVSDIEMPVMDGWEFAREARRRGIKTPFLALTSLSGMQYESKAKECGFDGYETKLDHTRLLKKVSSLLSVQAETS